MTLIFFLFILILHDKFVYSNNVCEREDYIKKINIVTKRFINIIPQTRVQYDPEENFENYDFIVVGSGSSGSALASRLSEIFSWKILLLEAGNPGNVLTKIPLIAPIFQLTPYNWNYTMEKQDGICLAMEDQTCNWPRGKSLGGTSVINYMIYTRGNPIDYKKWCAQGNPGWSYEEVLPYYLKSEKCRLSPGICSNSFHNTNGPLSIEHPFKSRLTDAFIQAGVELGEKIVDYNSENFMGFGQLQATINHGQRHSAADAFIYPIINKRKNLRVLTAARVTKILIEPVSKKAYGVVFRKKEQDYIAKASKEVIVSAGTFNSPQLLMLSGIGPKKHLKELNIPIIQNLPVGQLLYDHIAYIGLAFTINETVEPRESILNFFETFNFILNGKGIFTSLGGIEAVAYINTGSTSNYNYPDVELLMVGGGSLAVDFGQIVARELRVKREFYNAYYKPLENTPTWTIFPMLLHPKSRGYLKLQSTNPYVQPLMYGNYFTDPEGKDINTLLASIRYIQKLSKTLAFQKFDSKLYDKSFPGCENHSFDSDSYWLCALRSLTVTLHHQVGTCKMGPLSDPEAVVDSRLRVYGVENLRVVDSSVIPVTLSAHTNAPAIMVGEKASDIIKQEWGM